MCFPLSHTINLLLLKLFYPIKPPRLPPPHSTPLHFTPTSPPLYSTPLNFTSTSYFPSISIIFHIDSTCTLSSTSPSTPFNSAPFHPTTFPLLHSVPPQLLLPLHLQIPYIILLSDSTFTSSPTSTPVRSTILHSTRLHLHLELHPTLSLPALHSTQFHLHLTSTSPSIST